LEVGPEGGAEDVGVAFALPDVGVDVGSSSIAALGEEGYAEVQSNGVEGVQALGRPVALHQFIHDEDIRLSIGGDGGQGAFEGKVGSRQFFPCELDPTFWSKVAMQLVGKVLEGLFRPDIALNQLHVLKVQVMGGRVTMAVENNGLQMFDQLGVGGVVEAEALEAQGTEAQLARESFLDGSFGQSSL